MAAILAQFYLFCLALPFLCHAQLFRGHPRLNSDIHLSERGINGQKSGAAAPLVNVADDAISDDIDHPLDSFEGHPRNRFSRDIVYENHFAFAPWAHELAEEGGLGENPGPELTVNEIHELTTTTESTTTTSTTTSASAAAVEIENAPSGSVSVPPGFRPINIPSASSSSSDDKFRSITKFTSLSSGSVYIALPHPKRECKRNSECYRLREPDEWFVVKLSLKELLPLRNSF